MDHHPRTEWTAEPAAIGGRELAIMARSMLAARRALHGFIPVAMIHDPALDLLLQLFVANAEQRYFSIDELIQKTTTSENVTERWLLVLKDNGLAAVVGDIVILTENGEKAVQGAIRAVAESQWHLDAV